MSLLRSRTTAVVASAAVVVAMGATGSVAAGLIGSADIKNNSVRSIDIKNHTIQLKDIRPAAVNKLQTWKRVRTIGTGLLFEPGNPSVSITPDGVEAGLYVDGGCQVGGGQCGGGLFYNGLNGRPLSAVRNLAYNIRFTEDGDNASAAPYLRIFLGTDADPHDAIFSPNTQGADSDVDQGEFNEYVATAGTWRYDDDPGNGLDMTWAQLVAAHGNETITGGISITTGYSAGVNLRSLLRWWEINGKYYYFAQ